MPFVQPPPPPPPRWYKKKGLPSVPPSVLQDFKGLPSVLPSESKGFQLTPNRNTWYVSEERVPPPPVLELFSSTAKDNYPLPPLVMGKRGNETIEIEESERKRFKRIETQKEIPPIPPDRVKVK